MTMLSQTGCKKRRESLLVLFLGLSLFLIGCVHQPTEEAASSEVNAMPGLEAPAGEGQDLSDDVPADESLETVEENSTEEAPDESSDEPSAVTEDAEQAEVSRQFLRPASTVLPTNQAARQPEGVAPSPGPIVSTPIMEVSTSSEPLPLQNLSSISETVYAEINVGRQGASLEPLAWDSDLEVESQDAIESVYEGLAVDDLDSLRNTDGYLIHFSSDIQLGETEMIYRFNELLENDNSLRAGLFDDRFTRVGIASGLSIRPEATPSYVYICHINPSSEPLTAVTTTEPVEEPSGSDETTPPTTGESGTTNPAETETTSTPIEGATSTPTEQP